MISITNTHHHSIIDTTENLFKIYILFYIVRETDKLLLVTN